MSSTTDFITELYRAANEVRKLTPFERRRLLERAVATIRAGQEQVGGQPDLLKHEKVAALQTVAESIASAPEVIVGHALLEGADMIRTLKIVLDAKDEGGE